MFDDVIHAFRNQTKDYYITEIDLGAHSSLYRVAQERYLHCLRHKKIKHYPFNLITSADEYTSFLIFLATTAYSEGVLEVAEACYLINRRMNGFDCYYTRAMPDIFHLEHPIGSVLGNAVYGNYFVCYQAVTIGGDRQCNYPTLGDGVVMYARSSAIGACKLGNNSSIGAHAMIFNDELEENTVIKSQAGSIVKARNKQDNIDHYFQRI